MANLTDNTWLLCNADSNGRYNYGLLLDY